jgi:hypothetical protein
MEVSVDPHPLREMVIDFFTLCDDLITARFPLPSSARRGGRSLCDDFRGLILDSDRREYRSIRLIYDSRSDFDYCHPSICYSKKV